MSHLDATVPLGLSNADGRVPNDIGRLGLAERLLVTSQCGSNGHSTREARFVESIDSTTNNDFQEKNSTIPFSAPENPYIRGLVKNRQRFEKSTRSDQFGTVEPIDSTTNIDFQKKEEHHSIQRPRKPS